MKKLFIPWILATNKLPKFREKAKNSLNISRTQTIVTNHTTVGIQQHQLSEIPIFIKKIKVSNSHLPRETYRIRILEYLSKSITNNANGKGR